MKFQNLNNLVKSIVNCSGNDLLLFRSLFKEYKYKRKALIIKEGDDANLLYYINEGYLRTYFYVDGNQVTIQLNSPNEFSTSFVSFYRKEKSKNEIQCLTDCVLLGITLEGLQQLYKSSYKWQEFGFIMRENVLIKNEERISEQLVLNAEQRYIRFVENNPELIKYCPVKYIASYLGIHPESLSRIRRNIFSNKC